MGMTIDELKAECRYCYREVDASGLESFRCTNKTVNMETSWCRPKNANEPCSICEYCKPREEMGMTIEEHIKQLKKLKSFHNGSYGASVKVAIETMHKYQKITEILNSASYVENGTVYSYTYDEDTRVKHIREVVEDENVMD